MGVVGIARAFTKGGYENQSLTETLEIMTTNMKRDLYTLKAREVAEKRKEFMQDFVKKLEQELRAS